MNIREREFVDTVYSNLNEGVKAIITRPIFKSLFQKDGDIEEINQQVRCILHHFTEVDHSEFYSKRYRFSKVNVKNERDQLITIIFNKSFKNNPSSITENAEKCGSQGKFYPTWKKICWIQAPKCVADVVDHWAFKISVSIAASVATFFAVLTVYDGVVDISARKIVPFIINNIPVEVIRVANYVIGVAAFVFSHPIEVFLVIAITKTAIDFLPEIPYITTTLKSLDLWKTFSYLISGPETIATFAFDLSGDAIKTVWNTCEDVAKIFYGVGLDAENEKNDICRKKSYDVWQDIMSKQSAFVSAAA